MNDRNLVILLTGQGVSALATLRLIGPAVPAFLAKHFSRSARPRAIVHGELRDDSGVIDDPVVALAADSTFVDITLHGGVWVVEAAIECAERAGFVRADADQFPLKAFTESADRFDAELQAVIPLARTELALRTLLAQRSAWEAWFNADSDRESIDAILADRLLEHLLHPPSVAIVGLPNAGKSTLANQLFGTDRSIVSPIAGTTRDWVGEEANLDGLIVRLLDTPGRHETSDLIERQAIVQSDRPISEASLVIVLFDASRPFASQSHLLDLSNERVLAAANKMDAALADWSVDFLASRSVVPIIARDSSTVVRVAASIRRAFDVSAGPLMVPRCWTRRQRDVLLAARTDQSQCSTFFGKRSHAKFSE